MLRFFKMFSSCQRFMPVFQAQWGLALGVSGDILPQKMFEIWSPEIQFPAFWASKFALKFMLTVLVFEIKEGKKHKK